MEDTRCESTYTLTNKLHIAVHTMYISCCGRNNEYMAVFIPAKLFCLYIACSTILKLFGRLQKSIVHVVMNNGMFEWCIAKLSGMCHTQYIRFLREFIIL